MSTTRGDGSTISSGIGPEGSGTIHAGGGDISSGFVPTPSGTVHAGGPDISSGFGSTPSGTHHAGGSDISSGFGPAPASAGIHVNIGEPVIINTITYKYEGVISKSTGEAEIFLLSKDGTKCVFKLYRPNFRPKEDVLKQLKQINHKDIINVIDYGYFHHRFFEVMEYAEGGTLESYLPIRDVDRLRKILTETINAFKFCHAKGIVHKDIKPENLFFKNSDGTDILIGDFGISSSLDIGKSRHLTSQSLTVGYAAPEMYGIPDRVTKVIKIIVGKEVDYYALGITIIHLWDGRSPFDELGVHAIANLTTCGTVRIPADMPQEMQKLVKGLITVDYTKRWGYEEVQRWLNGEDVPVHFHIKEISYSPFRFSETEDAETPEELASLLKKNPSEIGKKKLYSGKLSAWVNLFNQKLAAELDGIVEDDYPKNQDAGFQKAIYLLDLDEPFAQNGKVCRRVDELACALEEDFAYYMSVLDKSSHRFYLYLEAHDSKKEADTFRKYFQTFSAKKALNTIILELQGRESFKLGGELFVTPEELLRYKDQQFLVNELKDKDSKISLWIDGAPSHEIKKQLEMWRGLKICNEATLSYVSATGNGIPQIEISKASFSYSDLRVGASFADSFTISNTGGGVLSGRITSDKKWLKVSQGMIDTNRHNQNVDFSIATANLPFGFKEAGKIEIQSNVGVEIVEVDISMELGTKAAARFRMGMTIVGSIGGLLFGLILNRFYSIQGMNEAISGIAGLTGIIGISIILAKSLIGSGIKIILITILVTLLVGLLLLDFLKFNSLPALSMTSWAMVFGTIACMTSPAILRNLQIGKKKIPAAIGVSTIALSAVIIFSGSEVAYRIAADHNEVPAPQTKSAIDPVAKKTIHDGNDSPIRAHLSPEWLGTWKQQDGNMTITISAVKLAFDEVMNVDGEVDRFQYEHNWLEKVTANVEEGRFGYSGKRVAPSDIAVLLESAIARFRQDPADFGIGDPAASRRAIASISPGMHAVIWSYGGGEWYQEYIVDGDRMLQWTDDPHYGFGAHLFNRVR